MSDDILTQLITISNKLGDPANDYVILGEGNTSAKKDDDTFWVKASGTQLHTIGADGFVEVSFKRVLAMLNGPELSDNEVKEALIASKVDPQATGHPSVETVLHTICLSLVYLALAMLGTPIPAPSIWSPVPLLLRQPFGVACSPMEL